VLDWLFALIPILKGIHIAALILWCGGILALPMMLSRHAPDVVADDYRMIRHATHLTYTLWVTPAAVIAVIAGTWLIFLREAFVPWLFAKLFFVALLVAAHVWIGHIIARNAEDPEYHTPPRPYLPAMAALLPMVAILTLVLAKPAMDWVVMPDWLLAPRGGQLPFDVPSR
jgi:uncharacterized membrane protein